MKGMSLRNGLGTAERYQGGNRTRALRHDRCHVGAAPRSVGFRPETLVLYSVHAVTLA